MPMFSQILRGSNHDLLEAAIIFAVTLIAGYALQFFGIQALRRLAARNTTDLDDQIVEALATPARLWTVLLALIVTGRELSPAAAGPRIRVILVDSATILLLVSVTMLAGRLTIILLRHYAARSATAHQITTLTVTMIRLVWAIPATLIVLRMFGVSPAPLLTAVGVGGIAVALGLQNTLSNLFAGFYVSLAGQFHQGDYVRLSSGEEGYVADIQWRVTSLRTLQNNMILIPNSKLAEAIVTNYSHPDKSLSLNIAVGVGYSTDIEQAERALLEEAAAVSAEIPSLLTQPAPVVRLSPGFGDFALQLTLSCRISEFTEQFRLQDILRRRILERFRRDGIDMPFPTQTVHLASLPPPTRKE
jgi:small-conductance mechanosensitive channel